uniref:tRNA (adenine(58)-N(1))-methyltransferase n=1 Tax=Romanomermis culicivorax TaxID=13658 RepID=A0A915JDD9_ROMCU
MVSRTIAVGDDVIIYANYKQCYLIKVTEGQTFQSRFGALTHDDLIGRRFGTKVQCSKGYVYVLRSTPELYTSVLRHRTQILYPHDISLILCQLEVKSGRKDLLIYCQPTLVNVCSDGFDPSTFGRADAIFLDLPSPWLVVPYCMKAYRRDKLVRFCSFSPCIEQVQKTCEKLREFNFSEILTVECVPREYKIVDLSAPLQDFGGKGVAARDELIFSTFGDMVESYIRLKTTAHFLALSAEIYRENFQMHGLIDFCTFFPVDVNLCPLCPKNARSKHFWYKFYVFGPRIMRKGITSTRKLNMKKFLPPCLLPLAVDWYGQLFEKFHSLSDI